MNVLIVDDSAVMRTMITRTLRLSGVPVQRIREAANGAEGLAALSDEPADLVLLDVNMPVMDGEQMMHRMRERPELRGTPVIVVSTEGSQTRIAELRALGAEFVHKPFTPEMLRDVIYRITGQTDGHLHVGNGAVSGDDLDF